MKITAIVVNRYTSGNVRVEVRCDFDDSMRRQQGGTHEVWHHIMNGYLGDAFVAEVERLNAVDQNKQ